MVSCAAANFLYIVEQLLHCFRINQQIITHASHKEKSPTCKLAGDFTQSINDND
jgi:hypothetical protein